MSEHGYFYNADTFKVLVCSEVPGVASTVCVVI